MLPDALPAHLKRRVLPDAPETRPGQLVIAWLRVSVRGHENPVLDVARVTAAALGLPLLVYHAVSERYPHASDRHHTFILEGARDLAQELSELGLAAAFHVERPGHRGPVLRELAADAALVVADAMPLDPLRAWTRALAAQVPLWTVDASCVVPLPALDRPFERAFQFRDATARQRGAFEFPWPPVDASPAPYRGALPFEPVDLRTADLAALVGACDIDHTVAPVPHTRGGAVAGYARWRYFCDGPLARYPKTRNDPLVPDGVSRLSAYLHYGHVSPFRIAREASQRGAAKYLDELLIWRELAWHFCHHVPEARSVDALPAWARQTLSEHADDPRDVLPLDRLEPGRTGDALWDACQRSLVRHGELHNNLRMTWGKAMLRWSKGPRQTLARLFELNDRYALDGRDPASVGGIRWCLGGSDRPFTPPSPVMGTLRPRDLEHHAQRLDVPAYAAHVRRPPVPDPPRVLVIGAGLTGAVVASTLDRSGLAVTVADKARGPGGRLSSRRSPHGRYDHGATGFTARDPRFVRQVRIWQAAGLVAPTTGPVGQWSAGHLVASPDPAPRFVAVPRMSALPRHALGEVAVQVNTRVTHLERVADGWRVHTAQGSLGTWDRVVITAPLAQAIDLVQPVAPGLAEQLSQAQVAPCWAVMGTGAMDLPFHRLRLADSALALAVRQDVLPGRDGPERWVLHASAAWSADHLEDAADTVADTLVQTFARITGASLGDVQAHRWRYARVTRPLGLDALEADGLLVAGDALRGGRIEDAWLSGAAAAGRILRRLDP